MIIVRYEQKQGVDAGFDEHKYGFIFLYSTKEASTT